MTRALVWRLTKSTHLGREISDAESVELSVRLSAAGVPIARKVPSRLPIGRKTSRSLVRMKSGCSGKAKSSSPSSSRATERPVLIAQMAPPALQFPNQLHAVAIEDRIAGVRDEGAVEIGADELNFGGHAEPECRNGFRLRNGADHDYDQEDEKEKEQEVRISMKSASRTRHGNGSRRPHQPSS